ncbi:MAG: acetyl-CoA carboxylase biotin carboxylase subunit [Carboxydocellales bacterium]
MFNKILIANRGEIAVRIIRACKELDIKAVAVFSEVDKESMHVKLADEAVCIGEPRSYLDMAAIIRVAKETGAEAIHPGFGFLSENAGFASQCIEAGLIFIGPSPEAIDSMGDKAVARETMMKAGVPVVPGSEAILEKDEDAHEIAVSIGYPVLIKASAGGGGRGMRIAHNRGEILDAVRGARSEALSAFGNSEVYIEKYLDNCRHVEFQILADNYGNVVYLGERDCSVQRRNQKLIEEAPSPALSQRLRQIMGEVAVAAAKAVNYSGAGTIEFLLTAYGEFYFMEMNTRIQVEHPVTEQIVGIDIVKEQISIAANQSLGYEQKDIVIRGHAIECRINAENPYMNFMPNPGTITTYSAPGGFGVRMDSAAYTGYTITPYYDSMIGKLIVWGKDRDEAIARMRRCLQEFQIEGVETTIPFHLHVLKNKYFQKGDVYTNFITKRLEPFVREEVVLKDEEELQEQLVPGTTEAVQELVELEVTGQEAINETAVPMLELVPTGEAVTPEILALITAAVGSFTESDYQITEIRKVSGEPVMLGISPWRMFGLNSLMMSRMRIK